MIRLIFDAGFLLIEVEVNFGRPWHFSISEHSEDGSFDSFACIDELVLHVVAQYRRVLLDPIGHHFDVHLKFSKLEVCRYVSILDVRREILRCRHLSESFSLQTFLDDFVLDPHHFVVKYFLVFCQFFSRHLFEHLAHRLAVNLNIQ